jgi:hypothetical protein
LIDIRNPSVASPVVRNYLHYEVDQVGIYLLYFLAILGVLALLKRRKTPVGLTLIAGACGLSVLAYGGLLLNFQSILPERWFLFLSLFIAVLAAVGLVGLIGAFKKKVGVILLVLLIFSTTFLMITSTESNTDSPLFWKGEVVGTSYKQSEIQAADTLNAYSNETIYVDHMFADYFWWDLKKEISIINFSSFVPPNRGVLIERSYIYERPTRLWFAGPYAKVDQTFQVDLQPMDKIYSNGEVNAYHSPG